MLLVSGWWLLMIVRILHQQHPPAGPQPAAGQHEQRTG
jgi:hypothetical protein